MENKELYRIEIAGSKVQSVALKDDVVTFTFENGRVIKLNDEHHYDCCERVYADFSNFPYHAERIVGKEFDTFIVKGVSDIGFLVCFENEYEIGEKVLVPCYNEQNGYYSNELKLLIADGDKRTEIDLVGFKEDRIC